MSEQLPYLLYNEATGTGKIVRRKQPEGGFTGNLTRELKYEEYLNSLPSIPVHDDLKRVWKDGGKYYEGKDFELKLLTDKEQTPSGISRKYTHMAIPTTDKPQHQSVDELYREIDNHINSLPREKTRFPSMELELLFTVRDKLKGKIISNPQPQPTHISVDDLCKQLEDQCKKNFGFSYIGETSLSRPIAFVINTTRELLQGKVITTPEVIKDVYRHAYNEGFNNADGAGNGDYGVATFLKQTFGIETINS